MEPVSTHGWVRLGVVISRLWEKVDLSVVPVLGDTVGTSSGEIKVVPWGAAEILNVLSIVASTLGPDLILDRGLGNCILITYMSCLKTHDLAVFKAQSARVWFHATSGAEWLAR